MHAVGGSTRFNLQTFAATGTQAASRLTAGTSTWATYRYSPVHSSAGLVAKLSFSPSPWNRAAARAENSPVGLWTRSFLWVLVVTGDCWDTFFLFAHRLWHDEGSSRLCLHCNSRNHQHLLHVFQLIFFSLSVLQLRFHRDSRQQVLAFHSH